MCGGGVGERGDRFGEHRGVVGLQGGHVRHQHDLEFRVHRTGRGHQQVGAVPVLAGEGEQVEGEPVDARRARRAHLLLEVGVLPVAALRGHGQRPVAQQAAVPAVLAVLAVGAEVVAGVVVPVRGRVVEGERVRGEVVGEHQLPARLAGAQGGRLGHVEGQGAGGAFGPGVDRSLGIALAGGALRGGRGSTGDGVASPGVPVASPGPVAGGRPAPGAEASCTALPSRGSQAIPVAAQTPTRKKAESSRVSSGLRPRTADRRRCDTGRAAPPRAVPAPPHGAVLAGPFAGPLSFWSLPRICPEWGLHSSRAQSRPPDNRSPEPEFGYVRHTDYGNYADRPAARARPPPGQQRTRRSEYDIPLALRCNWRIIDVTRLE